MYRSAQCAKPIKQLEIKQKASATNLASYRTPLPWWYADIAHLPGFFTGISRDIYHPMYLSEPWPSA